MEVQAPHERLQLPSRMRSKLEAFRKRVWMIKLAEGALAAVFGLLVSYLAVFALDRLWDTPASLRVLILVAGTLGLSVWLPWKWHRWVRSTRRLEEVARILRLRFPRLGDQLLGIVELVRSDLEQERSLTLCRAAIEQVDEETSPLDFSDAVPNPTHHRWAWAAGVTLGVTLVLSAVAPAAGTNALVRWLLPWSQTERYTFARLGDLPNEMVVPYAEPFSLEVALAKDTSWSPQTATARYGNQQPVSSDLVDGGYSLAIPPQKEAETLQVSVGDAKRSVEVLPTTRPELTSMTAQVQLPDYLAHSESLVKDIRGGSVSLVKGSRVVFEGTATRELATAAFHGAPQAVQGDKLVTTAMEVHESVSREFTWVGHFGLSSKDPFVLTINADDDQSPAISCSRLASEQIVLEEDVLSFQVRAQDDFGVKSIGMEWLGVEDAARNPKPAQGQKLISAGGPQKHELAVDATFSAKREGVGPQTLLIRFSAIDYLPDREPAYSPTYVLHILSPDEHAVWLTNQLRKWLHQAQEVYEREQQLHATNRELRELSPQETDLPETRRRIETQAAAESANARRLSSLTNSGEQLVQQATRNDQFNVATLESLAEMVQTLKDIAGNRMPSIVDLLKQAASAPTGANQPAENGEPATESDPGESPPRVGVNRDARPGKGDSQKPAPPSKVPNIVDVESGFNDLDSEAEENESEQDQPPAGPGRLTLPVTVVQGGGLKQEGPKESCPANEKLDEAVEEQADLLADFAKVAEELQRILNNLEGSTFVKRLKAASRRQLEVAREVNGDLLESFGAIQGPADTDEPGKLDKLAEREVAQSDDVFLIQEDLQAYFNRVQEGKFRVVLDEMRTTEVVDQLRNVAVTLNANHGGQAIAQTEFWADTLDRWAEQLVGPGCPSGGT